MDIKAQKAALRAQLDGLEPNAWQTPSGPYSDNCVAVAFLDGGVAVGDSTDPDGPKQVYTLSEWAAFIDAVDAGKFRQS
jgi:hypothetical protein